jgi:hypothetical protein
MFLKIKYLKFNVPIGNIMLHQFRLYGIFHCTAASMIIYQAMVTHRNANPTTIRAISPAVADTLDAELAVSQVPRL